MIEWVDLWLNSCPEDLPYAIGSFLAKDESLMDTWFPRGLVGR